MQSQHKSHDRCKHLVIVNIFALLKMFTKARFDCISLLNILGKNREVTFFPISLTDVTLGIIPFYGGIGCTIYYLLTCTEIIVLKVIYIYKYSTIAVMNEYFLKKFLISFNIIVAGIHILNLVTSKEYETSSNPFLSCMRSKDPLSNLLIRSENQYNPEW